MSLLLLNIKKTKPISVISIGCRYQGYSDRKKFPHSSMNKSQIAKRKREIGKVKAFEIICSAK